MVTQNSIGNQVTDNDFQTLRTAAGTPVSNSAIHSDNTNAASSAVLRASVGGASGGDPTLNWNIAGVQDMAMGMDNTDSDTLKITNGADPSSGTTLWSLTTAGVMSTPTQPAFRAFLAAPVLNVTGNGADYTIAFANEQFDQGNNYNTGTFQFTAAAAGNYFFQANIQIEDLAANMTSGDIFIRNVTTALNYSVDLIDIGSVRTAANTSGLNGTLFIQLAASDVIEVHVLISGGTGDTADISGDANGLTTWFSGWKV